MRGVWEVQTLPAASLILQKKNYLWKRGKKKKKKLEKWPNVRIPCPQKAQSSLLIQVKEYNVRDERILLSKTQRVVLYQNI